MRGSIPVFKPQQKRSEESLGMMLAAAKKLAAQDGFESASVAEIAKEAGFSVGAFYARFKDKDALFNAIQYQTLNELETTMLERIKQFSKKQKTSPKVSSIESVSAFAVDTLIDLYSTSPGLIKAIFMQTRIKRDPKLIERIKVFNTTCVETSLPLLVALTDQRVARSTQAAWVNAISVIGVYLREQILFGDPMPTTISARKWPHRKTAVKILVAYMKSELER